MTDFTDPVTGKVCLKNFIEYTPAYASAAAAYDAWASAIGVSNAGSDVNFGTDSNILDRYFDIVVTPIDGTSTRMAVGMDGLFLYGSTVADPGSTFNGSYGTGGVFMTVNYNNADNYPTILIGAQFTTGVSSADYLFGNLTKVRASTSGPPTLIGIIYRGTGTIGTGQTIQTITAFKLTTTQIEIYVTNPTATDESIYVVAANQNTNTVSAASRVKTGIISSTVRFMSDDLAYYRPTIPDGIQIVDAVPVNWNATDVLADTPAFYATPIWVWGQTLTGNIGIAQTYKIDYGQLIADLIKMQDPATPAMRYSGLLADVPFMADAIAAGFPESVADAIGVSSVLYGSLSLTVLAGLGFLDTASPQLRYTQLVTNLIAVHDDLRRFFAGTIAENIGVQESLTPTYRPSPVVVDAINLASSLTPTMTFRVIAEETLQLTDIELLQMIFSGVVEDGIQVTAGYLAPGDEFTTWSVNTRTSAVTEYKGYAFNSFAKLGNGYIGASDSGLYRLSGDTDNAASIIADIKSGMMQIGGFKFSSFKAAYVGLRGTGDFVLRLVTGEGVVRDYALKAQDMKTTRVNLGKGLRARFFAFELISTGSDFDLDGVELIPIVADRRV